MKIKTFTFNDFQENTYVLYDETNTCVIVDAGCYYKEEQQELLNFIKSNVLKVDKILSTHSHIDHVLGNYFVAEIFKADLYIHPLDLQTLKAIPAYAPAYGFHQYTEKLPDHFFNDGDFITFGNTKLKVIFAPGHAPGHVVFFHEKSKQLIGGDVLFYRSIGRTDLPGGDHNTLIRSIHENVFPLGDDVKVYSGHGPTTIIGEEKIYNPFCALV